MLECTSLVSCFSRSSVFMFCQASWVDHCHVLCCYVGVQWLSFLLHSRWHHAVNRRIVPFLFCSPFANRASDSGDLYIDFDKNQLIFPAALLVFQVEAWFNLSFPKHAYALHMHALGGKDWTRPQLGKPSVPLEIWVDFGQNLYKDHQNRMHGLQMASKTRMAQFCD